MDIRRAAPVRGLVALVALVALIALVALPVLAADPSPSTSSAPSGSAASGEPSATASSEASGSIEPSASNQAQPAEPTPAAEPAPAEEPEASETPKPSKAPKADKEAKTPEIDARVTGTVNSTTDEKGRAQYTLTAGGKTYELKAGPPWFWGDDHPLKPVAGKAATIAGEQHEGSDEIEVVTVNGTAIREPGRPPWAGGWKRVGERHPGWSKEKQDRWQAKADARGGCFPPGHCKDKTKADETAE